MGRPRTALGVLALVAAKYFFPIRFFFSCRDSARGLLLNERVAHDEAVAPRMPSDAPRLALSLYLLFSRARARVCAPCCRAAAASAAYTAYTSPAFAAATTAAMARRNHGPKRSPIYIPVSTPAASGMR